ncbi:MAG: hypothetical protein E7420_02945 [Ruminococcaceae bacterium]|nr:hypothetical protein [Oscillospiraceae bacterium]
MKKFAVFSGFLGSGKTTTMIALTKHFSSHHGKAAMISNDLGHGVSLADNKLASLSGCSASEITDDCICYVNELLAERLKAYYDDGFSLVISDIPGFGVGALEHVYHGLAEKFPGRFELAPFTVLVEPQTLSLLEKGCAGELEYIYDTQLKEADLIVLNKCDSISDEEKASCLSFLAERYPHARTVAISALRGEGLEALSQALIKGKASMRLPDIGYGGEAFISAMGRMTELYIQYRAIVCCNDFDGTAYLSDLAERIAELIRAAGREIPHLKLLAWEGEGDYAKVDLIGAHRAVEINHRFRSPASAVAVLLNTSAECPADILEDIIFDALYSVSEKYRLELQIFKKETLPMG